jgi:hypothetical protein
MDQPAIDYVLTIVQLLAKGADDRRLSPMKVNILNHNHRGAYELRQRRVYLQVFGDGEECHGRAHPECGREANAIGDSVTIIQPATSTSLS